LGKAPAQPPHREQLSRVLDAGVADEMAAFLQRETLGGENPAGLA
jgi:hypothetical protein